MQHGWVKDWFYVKYTPAEIAKIVAVFEKQQGEPGKGTKLFEFDRYDNRCYGKVGENAVEIMLRTTGVPFKRESDAGRKPNWDFIVGGWCTVDVKTNPREHASPMGHYMCNVDASKVNHANADYFMWCYLNKATLEVWVLGCATPKQVKKIFKLNKKGTKRKTDDGRKWPVLKDFYEGEIFKLLECGGYVKGWLVQCLKKSRGYKFVTCQFQNLNHGQATPEKTSRQLSLW